MSCWRTTEKIISSDRVRNEEVSGVVKEKEIPYVQ